MKCDHLEEVYEELTEHARKVLKMKNENLLSFLEEKLREI
jgi:hypothetical protein